MVKKSAGINGNVLAKFFAVSIDHLEKNAH
jgi:hypothetical protein